MPFVCYQLALTDAVQTYGMSGAVLCMGLQVQIKIKELYFLLLNLMTSLEIYPSTFIVKIDSTALTVMVFLQGIGTVFEQNMNWQLTC
jgi:hypothetical protein